MRKIYLALFVALASGCFSIYDSVEPGAETPGEPSEPVLVAEVGQFTEGVVIDLDGNLYVSHEDQISKVTPDGQVSAWGSTPSPNGHKILADGTHVVCDREGAVYLLDSDGTVIRTIAEIPTAANDVTLDTANGGMYFSSPYGSQEAPEIGKIYHVDADGDVTIAATGLHYPNGIALRPDGQSLILGESFTNRILEFPVTAPGELGEPREFAVMPGAADFDPAHHLAGPLPDGMAFDTAGNLYVANYGFGVVRVFDTAGTLIRSIPTGATFTSNVAFAGDEMNVIYTVGSTGPTQLSTGVLMRMELPRVTGVTILPPAH